MRRKRATLNGSDICDMRGGNGIWFINLVRSLDRDERLRFMVKFAHAHAAARRRAEAKRADSA